MDEDQYRSTYHRINETRCWFEKGINSRRCHCHLMERFNLADREGVRCTQAEAQQLCAQFLKQMRHKAVFALQLTKVDGPLPHAKEARVQIGSMLGLQRLYEGAAAIDPNRVPDIHQLLNWGLDEYETIEQLPYETLIQAIAQVKARSRGKSSS